MSPTEGMFCLFLVVVMYFREAGTFPYQCFEETCYSEKNQYCNERIEIKFCEECTDSVCQEDDVPAFCKEYFCKGSSSTVKSSNELDQFIRPSVPSKMKRSNELDENFSSRLERLELFLLITLMLLFAVIFILLWMCCCFGKLKRRTKLMTIFGQMKRRFLKQGKNCTSEEEPLKPKDVERTMEDVSVNTDNSFHDASDTIRVLAEKVDKLIQLTSHGECVKHFKNSVTTDGDRGTSQLVTSSDDALITPSQKQQIQQLYNEKSARDNTLCNKDEVNNQTKEQCDPNKLHGQDINDSTSGFVSMATDTSVKTV